MKNYNIAISLIIIMLIYLAGKKRSRCGTCMGCKGKVCPMCPKYGGPGKKKQCCVKRKCSGIQSSSQLKTSNVIIILLLYKLWIT